MKMYFKLYNLVFIKSSDKYHEFIYKFRIVYFKGAQNQVTNI